MAKNKSALVMEDDWKVEDDLRTMCRAKEIERDKTRYAKVKALAKIKMMDNAAIAADDSEESKK